MTTFEFTGCPDCGSSDVIARDGDAEITKQRALAFVLSDTQHLAFVTDCKDCEYSETHSVAKR